MIWVFWQILYAITTMQMPLPRRTCTMFRTQAATIATKHTVCSANYLDICQMLVVDEGELSVTYRGETRTAGPGSLILLDCREPHSYHALTPIRMRWFHFAGSGSTAYTHLILNTHGFILPTGSNAEIEECVRRIMVSVHQNQPNPHIISLTINKLLVLLVLVLGEKKKSDLEIAIQDSADYMTYNYADKSLSIEHLSQRAALSTCYYMRKFKEYQSATPHQFLQTGASERRKTAAAHHLAEY